MGRIRFTRLGANGGNDPGPERGEARLRALKETLAKGAADVVEKLPDRDPWRPHTVGVIGAGFAGLATAYFLRGLGFHVEVFEAAERVGGRVWSHAAPGLPDRTVEYGAELIGYNHALWVGLARVFGLQFTELTDADTYEGKWGLHLPVDLNGQVVTEAGHIWEGMEAAFHTLDRVALDIVKDPYRPWEANAGPYDMKSLADWMGRQSLPPDVARAVDVVMSCNNTLPLSEQSLLGVLAAVSGGGGSAYWTDSEVMRCASGNMSLATEMKDALEWKWRTEVHTSTVVDEVSLGDGKVNLRLAGDDRAHPFDYVVLSVPPTAWHHINFLPNRPDELKMSTGPAVKFITSCRRRFWMTQQPPCAPVALSDFVGETWEGTDAGGTDRPDAGQPAVLSLFAGAAWAEDAINQGSHRSSWYAQRLGRLFPGYGQSDNVIDTYFVNWPGTDRIECGYSFPRKGMVTTVARALSEPYAPFQGRLVFAGEHTCPAFYGYMEGALESGLMAAAQIAEAVGALERGTVHEALLVASVAGRASDDLG